MLAGKTHKMHFLQENKKLHVLNLMPNLQKGTTDSEFVNFACSQRFSGVSS